MTYQHSIASLSVLLLFLILPLGTSAALISEWRLDGNTTDAAGDNHGVATGGPIWAQDRYGDTDKALRFDGVDDHVNCGTKANLSFGDGTTDRPFSISAWVKMDDHHGFAVVGKAGEYSLDNSNAFRLSLHDRSTGGNIGKSGGMLTQYNGKWAHLAATYDGSGVAAGITLYINGEAARGREEGKAPYKAMEPLGGTFTIGRAWKHARGVIDEVRIYSHVLSPGDIADLADYFQGMDALAPSTDDAGTTPRISIRRAHVPPVIDGNLSDPSWRQAQWHDQFAVHGSQGTPAALGTSFAFLHDNTHLILAVKADEPEPEKIKALVTERDRQTWMDDAFEFFIDARGDARTHYHFAVNTKGVLYDARVVRGGGKHEPEWSADATVATATGKASWTAGMRIPFSCLSFGVEDLTAWRLNVTRSRFITGTRELFTFAPVQGTFHDTPHFARAHIQDADLTPYRGWRLPLPEVKVLLCSGRLEAHIAQGIESASTRPRKMEIEASLHVGDQSPATTRCSVNVGGETQDGTLLVVPLSEPGPATLDVVLRDADTGHVCCSRRAFLTLDYQPLTVRVLQPHYQNAIFAGQALDEIVLEVEAHVVPTERQEYQFKFSLRSDREIIQVRRAIDAECVVVSAALPSLTPGRYQMTGRLLHGTEDKPVAEWHEVLRDLPPQPGEVRFNEHGMCLVDGEPFMPFGIAGGAWPKGIRDAVAFGCNTIENCSITLSDRNSPYLDQLQKAGLKLLVYPYPEGFPIPIGRRSGPGESLSAELASTLRDRVRVRKQHPAILAWYTGNEPHSPHAPPPAMKQIHELISDEDPYHPTVIINHSIALISEYVDAMALVMPDPYPGYLKDGGWARPRYSTLAVREAVRASHDRKPVWAMLQAHDGTLFGSKNRRAPTFVDLRGQLYQAVIAGARGFYWYCRYWIEPHVEIALTYLAREATVVRKAILAPASPLGFAVVHDGDALQDLHLSRRQPGKDTFLLAVSSSEQPRDLTFRVAALPDGPLFVVGESRRIEVRSGLFSDGFAPGATHIYSSNAPLAHSVRVAETLRDIEANAHPRPKPGNLAGKHAGAVVSVTERTAPQRFPHADYMTDSSPFSSWYRGPVPQQIDIVLPELQPVSRVVLDSNVSAVEIQVWRDGVWHTVAESKSTQLETRRETQTIPFPPVRTEKIRILAQSVKSVMSMPDRVAQIWEIEIYADK